MEFKEWRKSPDKTTTDAETAPKRKYYGNKFADYLSEQIREAQERGAFDNLQGMGKPLNLDDNHYAGDKAMGYNVLRSNGCAPREIDLATDVRTDFEQG